MFKASGSLELNSGSRSATSMSPAPGSASGSASASARKRSSRACLECRLAKTKCIIADDQDVCQRCTKFSFDCRFVQHHRGRKPVSKLAAIGHEKGELSASDIESDDSNHTDLPGGESTLTTGSGIVFARLEHSQGVEAERLNMDHTHSKASVTKSRARSLHELDTQARRRIWDMLAQKIPQRGSTYTFVSKGEVAHDDLNSSSDSHDVRTRKAGWDPASGNDLVPASTASSVSATQHFASTFRNLVRPVDRRTNVHLPEANAPRHPHLPDSLALFGPKDPVELGLISLSEAERLFDYFFLHINPWAMIFDPHLVGHDSLRASSPHLYTAVLFLASRYIEPSDEGTSKSGHSNIIGDSKQTSRVLGSHARSLTVIAFALGDRRMETGVAMYLSSVWKEADDNFTILYCSYAAKIMSDISTELLALHAPASDPTARKTDTMQLRLRRHQQRLFLFHFIQEHTHLLHFAPRPNFDRGPSLLRNLLAWSDDSLATEDDVLLGADIDSVLLQTKYKSIMETAQAQEAERDSGYRGGSECFLLLQSFMDELEGWRSRWEHQANKIDRRFSNPSNGDARLKTFPGRLSLKTRMNLLSIMRSSLVMQVSSIAFRASLRDINKAKDATSSTSLPSTLALLSTLDDRAEQVYYTCLDSALNLLGHTILMPASVLRHAQDMIMVLAPHAALLATYLISLPLPSVPQPRSTANGPDNFHAEHNKAKTRIRRRKVYERKSLELMRDTRECFRRAVVRSEDHVELCAQYFDSLLNVIEGETETVLRGPSALGGRLKRSRSSFESRNESGTSAAESHPSMRKSDMNASHAKLAVLDGASNANVDSLAAETLLNLHSESQPHGITPADTTYLPISSTSVSSAIDADQRLLGNFYPQHTTHHNVPSSDMFASTMAGTGMFGNFAASPSIYGLGTSSMMGGDFAPSSMSGESGVAGDGIGTGASTPVDWTWLQSFLDVPEFTWM